MYQDEISNPNILVNSDFSINQRGQTSYTVNDAFTVDGWKLWYGKLEINDDGSVTHTASSDWQGIRQYITKPSRFAGKTITISVKANSSTTRLFQISVTKFGATSTTVIGSSGVIDSGLGINSITRTLPSDLTDDDKLMLMLYTPDTNQSVTWYWAKLEIGSIATAYSPKPYEQELADCQVIKGGIATTYSNPNLLINGDFKVNQRNFTSADIVSFASKYTFDRWRYYHWGDSAEITKNSDGSITIYNTTTTTTNSGSGILYFGQQVEDLVGKTFNNETYTISCKYKIEYPDSSKKGDVYFYIDQTGATTTGTITMKLPVNSETAIVSETFTVNGTTTKFGVNVNLRQGAKLTLYWVKLETGSVATPFSPRPYAEELALCQRYYQRLRVNGVSFIAQDTSVIYSGITTPVTIRTKPTITNEIQTSVRVFGEGIKGTTNLVFNAFYDNILQVSVDASSLNLTKYSGGILVNGTITLDAEIY